MYSASYMHLLGYTNVKLHLQFEEQLCQVMVLSYAVLHLHVENFDKENESCYAVDVPSPLSGQMNAFLAIFTCSFLFSKPSTFVGEIELGNIAGFVSFPGIILGKMALCIYGPLTTVTTVLCRCRYAHHH